MDLVRSLWTGAGSVHSAVDGGSRLCTGYLAEIHRGYPTTNSTGSGA